MLSRALQRTARQRAQSSPFYLAFMLFVLCTFAFQGYATQIHVHLPGDGDDYVGVSVGSGAGLTKALGSQKGEHGKLPAKDDPANCPLCQQIMIAGAFVSPTAVMLVVPTRLPLPAPIVLAASILGRSISHNWQGRGPPVG